MSFFSGMQSWGFVVDLHKFTKSVFLDVAQGRMNGAPNETRTHSSRLLAQAC